MAWPEMTSEQWTFLGGGDAERSVTAPAAPRRHSNATLSLVFRHSKVSNSAKFGAEFCSFATRMHVTGNRIQSVYHEPV